MESTGLKKKKETQKNEMNLQRVEEAIRKWNHLKRTWFSTDIDKHQ